MLQTPFYLFVNFFNIRDIYNLRNVSTYFKESIFTTVKQCDVPISYLYFADKLRDMFKNTTFDIKSYDPNIFDCTFDKYISALEIAGNSCDKFSYPEPHNGRHFTNLKKLGIYSCDRIHNKFNCFTEKLEILKIEGLNYLSKLQREKIKKLVNLTSLTIKCDADDETITNDHLLCFKKLTYLNISDNNTITDKGLEYSSIITTLNILGPNKITNKGLKFCENLQTLILNDNTKITNEGLKFLRHLTELKLSYNNIITNDIFKHLPNLTALTLCQNNLITDEGLQFLDKIKKLNLKKNNQITIEGIKHMKNLEILKISSDNFPSDCLKNFPNLTNLEITGCSQITNKSLRYLNENKLIKLNVFNNKITCKGLKSFQNLKKLCWNKRIKYKNFLHLKNLEELVLDNKANIKDKTLKLFSCLKKLTVHTKNKITIKGLEQLKNLEYLCMSEINDDIIYNLSRLKSLKIFNVSSCKIKSEHKNVLNSYNICIIYIDNLEGISVIP